MNKHPDVLRSGYWLGCWLWFVLVLFSGCKSVAILPLPTQMATAVPPVIVTPLLPPTLIPPTFTPWPVSAMVSATLPVVVATATPTLLPTPFPTPIIYVVTSEDGTVGLSGIALKFGVDLATLVSINNLENPDLIQPGQSLIIPPAVSSDSLTQPIYYVKEGDTISTIASFFQIDVWALQQANPQVTAESLPIGYPLTIPLPGEYHHTVFGDTLLALAIQYDTSVEDLIRANLDVLDLNNPDDVPVNVWLKIPDADILVGYDCSPTATRNQVITYTIQYGEGIYCLSEKFNLSTLTLGFANANLLQDWELENGDLVLIPPDDGALYLVTEADVQRGTQLQDLMQWYNMSYFEDIMDWDSNPVTSLAAGQKLFLRHADVSSGVFDSATVFAVASVPPTPVVATGANDLDTSPAPSVTVVATSAPLTGEIPPDALRPPSNPWSGELTSFDTGSCGEIIDGSGWTGSLIWPVDNPSIQEGRGFRVGHAAIDLLAPLGANIYAAESGVVVWAGYTRWGGGNEVVLAHGNTWQTHYAHMDVVSVTCGQFVSRGAVIGTVGQTGSSSFPHVHFELRYQGLAYDATAWLP